VNPLAAAPPVAWSLPKDLTRGPATRSNARNRSGAEDWLVFRAVADRKMRLPLYRRKGLPHVADFAAKIGAVR